MSENKKPDLNFEFIEGVSKAYGLYAMSVIKGRALPRLEDGLKPVQRRIIYSMYDNGFRYNKPFKKSARVIGDVQGKYHPHGDGAIYEALVHMAQEFIMSAPLIKGHGNFGSIDGDKAAAMRYTQVKLEEISEYLVQDYEKNTVEMRKNYDESLEIPDVFPAQFPNLLVNGSSGIAVGIATNIPPHNLGEVLDAVVALLEDPNLELHEIMQYIKGPDFPTGGEFFGGSDLVKSYQTGRGRAILQSVIEEEEIDKKTALIVTEIPYQASKPKIIENISELVANGTLEDISDIRDESSMQVRIVIELKKNANLEVIKQKLLALTSLRTVISFNLVAIYEDKPHTFSLLEILRIFLKFREEIVIKRAEYILAKTFAKAHIVWGLLLASSDLDKVIRVIKASKNTQDAEANLMNIEWEREKVEPILGLLNDKYVINYPYHFSKEQAKGILELRLSKLTQLENTILEENLKELSEITIEQQKIIGDREFRKNMMKQEFLALKQKFAVPRRTKQLAQMGDFVEEDLIEKEDIVLITTANGYIKRINLDEYKVQNRGGKGRSGHKKVDDPVTNLYTMNTLTNVLFFTSLGKVFSLKAYQIPDGNFNSKGRAAVNLLKLEENERITTILPLENDDKGCLFFITTQGTVRKNRLEEFLNIRMNGKIAMKLEEGNNLHSVFVVEDGDEILLTGSNGNAIRFNANDIRIFESRASQGIKGMQLQEGEIITGALKVSVNSEVLCVTQKGFGKRSDFDEYRKIKRGGKGVKAMNINAKTGPLINILVLDENSDVLLMSKSGQIIRMNSKDIRKTGRVASGVCLMKFSADDYLTQAVAVPKSEIEEEN